MLVSWAVPKNLPDTPSVNHLAVHTEDHPMEYLTFAGIIPKGEYGGGKVIVWDTGTYETEKFNDDEVIVTLRGDRISGRYALIQTDGKNWLAHRMKDQQSPQPKDLAPPEPGRSAGGQHDRGDAAHDEEAVTDSITTGWSGCSVCGSPSAPISSTTSRPSVTSPTIA